MSKSTFNSLSNQKFVCMQDYSTLMVWGGIFLHCEYTPIGEHLSTVNSEDFFGPNVHLT